MADYSKFYYSSAEFKIVLVIPKGTPVPLLTLGDYEDNEKIESEPQHVVGEIDPVAIKVNARTYSGKLSAQYGEMELFLALNGLTKYTDIQNAVIIVSTTNGLILKTLTGVFITSKSIPIKAKDKATPVSLDFAFLNIK